MKKNIDIWIEKDCFKPGLKIRLKKYLVEIFYSGPKKNCDKLVDMHHTYTSLDKNQKTEFLNKKKQNKTKKTRILDMKIQISPAHAQQFW